MAKNMVRLRTSIDLDPELPIDYIPIIFGFVWK